MSYPMGGRPVQGGVPLNNSPTHRTPIRPRERSDSSLNGARGDERATGAPPPLMLATPPQRRSTDWSSTSPMGALPLNGTCDTSPNPGARPARPPPVGARPVPASSINSIAPLPPPSAPLNPGTFTNGRRRRRSSMSPPQQFQNLAASVPLLASQLGRPVSLGGRSGLAPHMGAFLPNSISPLYFLPIGNGRIMSRNLNGTIVAVTSHPSNESELQLYRVLQRAKLLSYYDTFIAQGGDDVHQLCEAGEEEFLEIMALVGMASKPLHVRRLQKSLQEWVQNPALFQAPLMPLSNFTAPSAPAAVIRPPPSSVGALPPPSLNTPPAGSLPTTGSLSTSVSGPPPGSVPPPSSSSPSSSSVSTSSNIPISSSSRSLGPSSGPSLPSISQQPQSPPPGGMALPLSRPSSVPHSPSPVGSLSAKDSSVGAGGGQSPTYSQGGLEYPSMSTSPSLQLTPVLVEAQIQRIAETAAQLVKALPANFEPNAKQLNKKKLSKELELVIAMSNDDGQKMEEIRKFSAIYGRFDCKRKPEKPLTLHEVSVNEASAQLCFQLPALLMRRDKLFHLSRKVVRDSGYQYSKGHSRSQFQADPSDLLGINVNGGDDNSSRDSSTAGDRTGNGDPGNPDGKSKRSSRYGSEAEDYDLRAAKRLRYHLDSDELELRRRERYEQINDEVRLMSDRMDELRSALGGTRDSAMVHAIGQQMELLQDKQARLLHEQQEHSRALQRYSNSRYGSSGRISTSSDPERPDTDDDSQMSFSNHSSPTASPKLGGTSCQPPSQHAGSYVLSASGGQIIAVQNPALSLSGALLRSPSSSVTSSHHHHDVTVSSHHDVITRQSNISSSTTSATPLSTLLNLSRRDESNGNGNEYYNNEAASRGAGNHLRELRSSRAMMAMANNSEPNHSSSSNFVFKEEPVSPPRSSSTPTLAPNLLKD